MLRDSGIEIYTYDNKIYYFNFNEISNRNSFLSQFDYKLFYFIKNNVSTEINNISGLINKGKISNEFVKEKNFFIF